CSTRRGSFRTWNGSNALGVSSRSESVEDGDENGFSASNRSRQPIPPKPRTAPGCWRSPVNVREPDVRPIGATAVDIGLQSSPGPGPAPLVTAGLRRRAAGVAVASAAFLTLTACEEKTVYAPPPPPKVIVEQPLKQPVTRYIEL